MIGRNAVLFSHAPEAMQVVAVIGAATALFAGTIGLVQNDIKRVLAYSTVSQLGYMFLAMGVGAFSAGIFHLYTHAFFKALLFLGSGAVIHALHGEQDLRKMGGLKKDLPITYWTFLIGAIAIAGVPGLAGFFSKDQILGEAYLTGHTTLWVVGVLTALLTATYMFRLVFMAFHGERHAPGAHGAHDAHGHADAPGHGGHLHDAPPAMALALIVLAIGSVVAGYVGVPAALGGHNEIEHYLAPSFAAPRQAEGLAPAAEGGPGREAAAAGEAGHPEGALSEAALMGISIAVALGGIGIAWYFFMANPKAADSVAESAGPVHDLLLNKYYVDEIYDAAIVEPIVNVSRGGLWKIVDAEIIDGAVNGAGSFVSLGSGLLRRLQTGSVRVYAASFLLGVVTVLGYCVWRFVQTTNF